MADLMIKTNNEKWYTSKEMCEMNNVDERTLKRFNEYLRGDSTVTTKLIRKVGRAHSNEYSEEALKQFQIWLLHNKVNMGSVSEVVKQNAAGMISTGLTFQAVLNSGDRNTFNEYINNLEDWFESKQRAKQLEEERQLALEEKKRLEDAISLKKQPTQVAFDLGKYASAPLVNLIAEELNIVYKSERRSGNTDICPTDVTLHLAASEPSSWTDNKGVSHTRPQIYYLPDGIKMIEMRYSEIIDDIIDWGSNNYWPTSKTKLPAYWTAPYMMIYKKVREDYR